MAQLSLRSRAVLTVLMLVLLSSLAGAIVVFTSQRFQKALLGEDVDLVRNLPQLTETAVPSPTPVPDPVQLRLGFPAGIDACSSGVMTFIPEGVDPLRLPPFVPIHEWYAARSYVQATFTQLVVQALPSARPVEMANRVLVRVIDLQPLPGPANTAFAMCESSNPISLSTLQIEGATNAVVAKEMGEAKTLVLEPNAVQTFDLKLVATQPGRYTVNVGIEVFIDGLPRQIWSSENLLIQVPERINRWSGELLVNWGECLFENGSYVCEQEAASDPVYLQSLLALAVTPNPTPTEAVALLTVAVIDFNSDPAELCSSSPEPRLKPGDRAVVSDVIRTFLRVRAQPGTGEAIIGEATSGLSLLITSGPVCKTGTWWYQTELDGGQGGWLVEGENGVYYLNPSG